MFHSMHSLGARLMLGTFLALGSATAGAQDVGAGGYAGFGFGSGEVATPSCDTPVSSNNFAQQCDREIGYQLFGGYQFNRHLAVEGGYINIESISSLATEPGPDAPDGTPTTVSGYNFSTLYVAGVGRLPLGAGPFAVTGRIGLHNGTLEADGCPADQSCPDNADSTDLLYGIGAEFNFNRHLRAQVDYSRFNFDSNLANEVDVDEVDVVAASLVYRF